MAKIRNPLTVVNSRLQSKTLTLGASAPAAVSPDSGYDGLSSVPVTLDTSVFKAENIKSGVALAGITGTAGYTGLVLLDSCWYNASVWSFATSVQKNNSSAIVNLNAYSDSTTYVNDTGCLTGITVCTGGLKGIMCTTPLPITGYTTLHISLTMMPEDGTRGNYNWAHTYIYLCSSTAKTNVYKPTDIIKQIEVWKSAYFSAGYAYACFKREFTFDLSDITAANVYLFFSHCDGAMKIEKIWLT